MGFSYFKFKSDWSFFQKQKFLYSNPQPTDQQPSMITITPKCYLCVGDTEKKPFSRLQSCFTDSSLIELIRLIKQIQYKIRKSRLLENIGRVQAP